MTVLYWQLIVAGVVAWCFFLVSKKAARNAAIFWTIWTPLALFHPPLIIFQIAVAWGTYFLLVNNGETKEALNKAKLRVKKLEEALSDYPENVKRAFTKPLSEYEGVTLLDNEHTDFLIESLKTAKNSIIILSGWISTSIVDESFIKLSREAMDRGVSIYIGFGYANLDGRHSSTMRSDNALRGLIQLANEGRGKQGSLTISRFNNHQKLIIKDRGQVTVGSYNWLSNSTFVNKEVSIVIDNVSLANHIYTELRPTLLRNSL